MNDKILNAELDRVAKRFRLLARRVTLLTFWLVLGLVAVTTLRGLRGQDYATVALITGVAAAFGLVAVVAVWVWARRASDPLWLARRIEQRHPDLDARLLAAVEQHPKERAGLGFLQQMVIQQSVTHAMQKQWEEIVPARRLTVLRVATWGIFLISAVVSIAAVAEWRAQWKRHSAVTAKLQDLPPFTIKVEPENTTIERGTALLVMARFNSQRLPGEVYLLYRDGDNEVQQLAMSKSLDDPLFAARVAAVKRDGTYAVRYGDGQTPWYKVNVFDYPALKQADARLQFPTYTGLEEKVIQDTRSVSGVEGTHVTLQFHLNKPVAQATLVPSDRRADLLSGATSRAAVTRPAASAQPVTLQVDPNDPTTYTLSLDLKQSQNYQLQLVDADNRSNRDRPQMAINVTVNRPPDLKVVWPNKDLDVSALEEITIKTQVWDDFGVKRVGMTYAMVGQPPQEAILAENVPGKERRDLNSLISLEKLGAAPDQMLSYHLWAEDIGPDGKVRRVEGPMYFADVRPYEEIYRQGEEMAQGQEEQQQRQQQQQQQGQQQGNQNAQRAEQIANTLKQVIAATWNIMRRETAEKPSPQFVPDVTAVESSQSRIRQQADGLTEQVTDDRAAAFLTSGLKNMDSAVTQLKAAENGPDVQPLTGALASEQSAYNDLLKLRAREFEVTRSNRQQQAGSQSPTQQRRQQQANQMNPRDQQNPYQARRNAQQQQQDMNQQTQQETDEQRETRQVLSRLRELAQRQEDLNRQMQEMQSALQQAQTQEQRDEIQRQLANLREQQQQQLRDADDLRDRMDQPQNQESMADARQQLEQTRDNLQQAAQNLNNGQMQQAAAAGQRAGEQLSNLQNQMRQAAAGQFGQAMTQMRQDARNLEQQQQQIDQQLANVNQPPQTAPTGLRDPNQQDASQRRQQIAQDLQQQRQQLQNLFDNMQRTIEEADAPQPLLSRELYDTYRNAQQQQPDRTLTSARQLVQQGLLQEARQTNRDASETVTRLREGVDQAAATVLGDETAALRRAQQELDDLAQQLEREAGRAAATRAATQPDRAGRGQLAGATQPGGRGAIAGTQPDGRGGRAGTQPGERAAMAGTQPDGRGGRAGTQPGGRGGIAGTQPDGRGGQAGTQPGDRALALNDRGGSPNGRGTATARGGTPGGRGNAQTQPGDLVAMTQPDEQDLTDPNGQDQQLAGGGRGNPGLRDPNGAARGRGARGTTQPGDLVAMTQPGDPQDGQPRQVGDREARGGGAPMDNAGPITGTGYRVFTDNLRDIEELLNDPRLRDQAANIRQNTTNLRQDYLRTSRPPAWNIVQDTLNRPLTDLRGAVSQEIQRRESQQAAIPLDRDAVPPAYQDQVRIYYERLGSGK